MGICYVNGHLIDDISYIEAINSIEFKMRCIMNMPQKLFKYFSNTVSGNGRNYSLEALETNRVFMQTPKQFNDPYDSYFCMDNQEFLSRKLNYYLQLAKINFLNEMTDEQKLIQFATYIKEIMGSKEDFWTADGSLDLTESSTDMNCQIGNLRSILFENKIKHNLLHGSESIAHAVYQALLTHIEEEKEYTNFQISCFTVRNDNMLMWSHYANAHKGFCIEYEVSPIGNGSNMLYRNLYPVIYCDDISDVTKEVLINSNGTLDAESLHSFYIKALLRKSLDWKYEQEWRLVLYSKDQFTHEFFKIKKVYLGHYMPKEDRRKIIEFCKYSGIRYRGMKIENKRYRMTECDILCEDCFKYNSES